jgi:hypothetical protein
VCVQIILWNSLLFIAAWKIGPVLAAQLHDRTQTGQANPAARVGRELGPKLARSGVLTRTAAKN